MRKIILLFVISIISFTVSGQDFSNKGIDFWVPYPAHINTTQSLMGIYITSDSNTTGIITVGAISYPFSVTANGLTKFFIGPAGCGTCNANNGAVYLSTPDGIQTGAGIHITSVEAVAVFSHIIFSARSGATLVLPTNVWGKEYYVPSKANDGNSTGDFGYGELNVMASVPNTVVEITPTANSRNGAHPAGVPFTVVLANPGDVYQLQFQRNTDLSGTIVKSIASGTSSCQPIAVFSATTWSAFNCFNGTGGDNLYQQLFPAATWGKSFLTSALKKVATNPNDFNVDIIRVFVKDPTTVVTKTENGFPAILTGLQPGNFYEYSTSQPTFIEADQPVQVIQYITSQNCGNPQTLSDPEMIVLNSIEQTINDITVFSAHTNYVPGGTTQSNINTHYLNVIMKTNNTANFTINGATPNALFIPIPGTLYSYLKENVSVNAAFNPIFRLKADSGFSAIAYGFGQTESYGYNAGTNVKDLNTQLEISTPDGIETSPNICTGSLFGFKAYFPNKTLGVTPVEIRYDSMRWRCNSPLISPNNFPVMVYGTGTPPVITPDSVNIRNTREVAWYSIPGQYSFTAPGVYDIIVTVYRTSTEGCGNEQDYKFKVIVSDPPAPSFTHTLPGCYLEPVQFTETTPQTPKTTYKWFWDFGDGSPYSFLVRNPQHTYTAPGTYRVRYAGVTTPGCVTDTVFMDVVVPDVPSATIAGATNVCLNGASPTITFTGTGGIAPYQFTYQINGITQAPVVSNAGGTFTITGIPTNVAGPFTYTLIGVKNVASTLCTRTISEQAIINVVPLPIAAISTGATACLNGPSPNITFTGSGGVAPYTFTYSINTVTQPPVVSNGAGVYTIAVPTTTAGPQNYILLSVQESGPNTCIQNNILNQQAIVQVNPLPAAVIASTATAVCLNGPSPTVTFTGSGGTAPYTFTYRLNGVTQPPVVSNAGGTYTITVPTNVAIPLAYELISVQEGSANACTQPLITGQLTTITVNPLPAAAIGGATTVCLNAPSPTVTFTGSGGTAPYTFAYTINGVGQTPVVSNLAGVATVPAATNVSGPLLYAVTLVTDATATLCSQAYTNNSVSTVINVTPLPTAAIAGATAVCINGPSPNITFTGSGGIAPYTFTFSINGVTQAPVVSNGAGVYTIAAPTTAAGAFNYILLSVQESGPNTCIQNNILNQQAIIQVNPLPAAAIASTATAVCLNGPSPTVTFTGSGGTAPYTFIYTLNTLPQTAVVSNAGGTYTITVPTNATGTLTYAITSVQEGSANACLQSNVTGQTTAVTVNPLPTAAVTGSTTVCLNATQPLVTFVGSGSVAPYTFNYTINGVPQTPLVTNNTGGITVPAPTNVAGSFVYAITSVSDGTPNACSQTLNNITTTVTVRPLPVAAITGATAVCLNAPSPTITFTGSGGNAPYIITYTINGVTQVPVATNNAGLYTILVPTNVAGPINYTLLSIQESGPYACLQPAIIGQSATVMVNPLPTASIAAATTNTCLNAASSNITFTGLGGTAPYTFAYTINGTPQTPVISNNAGVAFVPVATSIANTFIYALTSVTDGTTTACSQLQTGTVTVIVHPLPTALISGNIEVCQNAASPAVTFSGAGGTAPYTFTYSVNGAPDVTVTTTVGNSVMVLQPTTTVNTYSYVLKNVQDASASACTQLQSGTVTVKVNPLPTAAITGSKLICINSASPDITFTGAGGTTPYTFRYRINGGALLTATTTGTNTSVAVSVATNVAGSFTYTLEDVRDGSITACLQTQTGSAKVDISNIFPSPLFAFNDTVCLPNALVQFQNQSTIANGSPNSMTYLWNFGDGSPTSNGFQPSHRYNAVGPFTVTLQATSNAGCVTTIPIAVNTIHAQPKAAFSINKPAGVCIGDNVVLTDLSDPKDGTTTEWNWDMGEGPVIITNPVTYKYTTATTYSIKLYSVNSFGCNSDTVSQLFTVHPYPFVDAGPDGKILEGGSYTMQPTVTGNDLQYLWSPANFLNSTTILAPTATGMMDDITYKLVVTGRGGCEAAADFVFIEVLKAPKVPNTFTPNGDGINEEWLIEYLYTYPNCKVQVFTRTGQLVFQSRGYKTPWNGKLNGKALPFDTYYYIIEPGNNRAPITGYVTIVK